MAILDRFRKKKSTTAKDLAVASDTSDKKVAPKAAKAKKAPAKKSENTDIQPTKAAAGNELAQRLLRKPHVSEKAARLADRGVYVFDVALDAEKISIKKAVESLYKVKVERVRIIRGQGKPVFRGKRPSQRKNWKKALVEVKKGERIDLYEGV